MVCKPILIVEDNEDICAGLQKFFEGEGFSVLLACHGQAALDLLEQTTTPKLGLILTDFRMPVMNGPAFILALEQKHPKIFADTPIFLMSAGAEINDTIKVTGFLEKPFDLDELSRIAAQHCSQD